MARPSAATMPTTANPDLPDRRCATTTLTAISPTTNAGTTTLHVTASVGNAVGPTNVRHGIASALRTPSQAPTAIVVATSRPFEGRDGSAATLAIPAATAANSSGATTTRYRLVTPKASHTSPPTNS